MSNGPAEPLRRERSTNGGPRQPSPTLAQPVGLGARGGRRGVGPAALRQHSTGHPPRIRARRGLVRHLSRAQGRWHACAGRRCAEQLHPGRPRLGGAHHRAREAKRGSHHSTAHHPTVRRCIDDKVEAPAISSGAMPGAVVLTSHCWGTTCPSGPTASRATLHQARSTKFVPPCQEAVRGQASA